MEIVATRDILPGEEILVDYGEEWERAWDEHVRNFQSPCSSPQENRKEKFMSSKFVHDMNNVKFNSLFHKWSDYHFTICSDFLDKIVATIYIVPRENTTDVDESSVSNSVDTTNATDGVRTHAFDDIDESHEGFKIPASAKFTPCKITSYNEDSRMFDVVVFARNNVLSMVKDLPEQSILFLNRPYKSDMFWSGAFRHKMKIPDEIFPLQWKDLKH